MPTSLRLDFVSDVACPWCAIGLAGLELALQRLAGVVDAQLSFQPFELNPALGPQGQDIVEHLTQKYGSTPVQQEQIRQRIRERGAAVGFVFKPEGRGRIWNTFDAHRLLHWAAQQGPQLQHALKKELLQAYHGRAENVSDAQVLARACAFVGLDAARAQAILASEDYALEVRQSEQRWLQAGIQAVPALVVNQQYLISGGQPPEAYEDALRRIAVPTQAQS